MAKSQWSFGSATGMSAALAAKILAELAKAPLYFTDIAENFARYDFRTIVGRDCVGDRSLPAHDANLFDMEQKYGDLMESQMIIAALPTKVTVG